MDRTYSFCDVVVVVVVLSLTSFPTTTSETQIRTQLIMDIVDGMKYLHDEHDSIHRDLKSANILLSKDERDDLIRGKVADFGMSKLVSQEALNQRDDHNKEAMLSLQSSNDSEEKTRERSDTLSVSSSMTMTLTSGCGTYVVRVCVCVCVHHHHHHHHLSLSLSLSLTHITQKKKK